MNNLPAKSPSGELLPPPPPHVSKHAKGRQPRKVLGQHQKGRQGAGAFAGPKKQAAKQAFLAASSEEAKRIANERSLKRVYREWRESMSPEELARARALKVHFPAFVGGEFRKPTGGEVIDFHDPADLPEAQDNHLPVDDIEPQSLFSKAIDALGSEEITAAADCFSAALTWSLDIKDQRDLVLLGRRALIMILWLREDLLGAGSFPNPAGAHDFCDRVTGNHTATGEVFGRVLEWIRRGATVSAIGERLCLVAYVVRPTMINSPTLEKLGEVMNKTRQAKDKLVSCLRDTFAGLRAAAQRGEKTRLVCQNAH
jgi:hypothetical protein